MTGISFAYGEFTLDATHRCSVPGCEWHIPVEFAKCWEHGGPDVAATKTDCWGKAEFHYHGGGEISEDDPRDVAWGDAR